MNVLFMAESLSKKPQGFLEIGTSLLASLFSTVFFHVVLKAEVHGCLSASQLMADVLMVIHVTERKHALSCVPGFKRHRLDWHDVIVS